MSKEGYRPKEFTRREFIKWTSAFGATVYLSYTANKKLLELTENISNLFCEKGKEPAQIPVQSATSAPTAEPEPTVTPTPTETPKPTPESQPRIYVVKEGDNLFRIGLNHGLSASESTNKMAVANNISSPFTIYPGQELIIPEKGVASTYEFSPLRVIVGEPKDYRLTHKDERFLSWLNEKTKFWTDWNGNQHQYFIPEDVFRDAKTAEKESGLPWYVLVAIGFTETGYYEGSNWDPDKTSLSGAQGRYQIMPFNSVFQPYEGSLYDPKLNALTATNYMLYLELGDIDKETWVWNFIGGDENNPRPCWNIHPEQAEVTWEIMQYLKENYLFAMEHVK